MKRTLSSFSLILATCMALVSCTTTSSRPGEAIDSDFFAVVADIKILDSDLVTINEDFEMSIDGAIGKEIEQHRREREGQSTGGDDNADFFLGTVAGAFAGLTSNEPRSQYKFHYNLRDMDDEVIDFFGDTILAIGDCVYVDVQSKRQGKESVQIAKVADRVCEKDA